MSDEREDKQPNRFDSAETLGELMHQVVGAGSVMWEERDGERVFMAEEALLVAADAETRVMEIVAASLKEFADAVLEAEGEES